MMTSLLPVRTLLLAIFMIMAGSGFLSTLIAVRLEQNGAGSLTIGLVATAYFTGLALGAVKSPRLIAQVGHIRAFTAFVSIYSATSLTYAITPEPGIWVALRFIDGIAMSGVFICLESWLNKRVSSAERSSVLAGYMIALYTGQAGGQFLLNLSDNAPALPFMVSAILLSLAVIPVALTRLEQPKMENFAPFSARRLYDASPLGMVGTAATGLMLGAFYALGAVYIQRIGMELAQIALFTSVVIGGGVALQWPLGMLSDRIDRRKVIVGCFAAVTALSFGMMAVSDSPLATVALGALFGGFTFALYPLCLAHSNDHLGEEERVGASGGLVMVYSIGAIVGPLAGSGGMGIAGPPGLFGMIGTIAALVLAFGFWRTFRQAPVPDEDQQTFQAMPRTSPMVAVLEAGPAQDEEPPR